MAGRILFYIFTFLTIVLLPAQKIDISFSTVYTKNGAKIIVENNEYCPVSIVFRFTGNNVASSVFNDEAILIEARTKGILTELKQVNPCKSYDFNYEVQYIRGDIKQIKGDDYLYGLPFKSGKKYKVIQGYNGNFSHQDINALDFNLEIGDQVLAAREGIIVATKSDSDTACLDFKCLDWANKVIIYHSDGTFGEYFHFKKEGLVVKPGDSVKQGQLLGYSGNTGFSSRPHLHFDVALFRFNADSTIYPATKFKTKQHPEGAQLISGNFYE